MGDVSLPRSSVLFSSGSRNELGEQHTVAPLQAASLATPVSPPRMVPSELLTPSDV